MHWAKSAWAVPGQCFSQATTTASLPFMSSTTDDLPSMCNTRDSLPLMFATKDSLPSLAPKEVSESENECCRPFGSAAADTASADAADSATDNTEDESAKRRALIAAKEEWRKQREAKKAQRKNAKRPSYGELLRKEAREMRNTTTTVKRPRSPGVGPRNKQPEPTKAPEPVIEAPRLIDMQEKLPTIYSVSGGASVLTSKQGSIIASQSHSRQLSRNPTQDALPEFNMEPGYARLLTRTTTRDSLPPIGDESESETESSEGSLETDPSPRPSSEEAVEADPAKSKELAAKLQIAHQEIMALTQQIEDMKFNNDKLQRTNDVLKAFCCGMTPHAANGCGSGEGSNSGVGWHQHRKDRRRHFRRAQLSSNPGTPGGTP
mmetsp:Transcript_5239/g.16141  ORF Transcript_5239/g.16141 Transcript_5239/m.16141 type:complete len:377 (+) Transcript_5239:2-1132(+)